MGIFDDGAARRRAAPGHEDAAAVEFIQQSIDKAILTMGTDVKNMRTMADEGVDQVHARGTAVYLFTQSITKHGRAYVGMLVCQYVAALEHIIKLEQMITDGDPRTERQQWLDETTCACYRHMDHADCSRSCRTCDMKGGA